MRAAAPMPMGEHQVSEGLQDEQKRDFTRALLADLNAFEQLLDGPRVDRGERKIGAEQEMFLVDDRLRPARVAMAVLETADDPRLTTELAQYNLEANLAPLRYGGNCLRAMEQELKEVLEVARRAASAHGAKVALAGILPTLQKSDLSLDAMSPIPRYRELNEAMQRMRGKDFHVLIKGIDEFELHHDNVMLEACNTSFQVHFQVAPEEFAHLYNLAQLVTAPVLAAAVNSPVLMGNRLWQETRIALFQHSVDTRSSAQQARAARPRVSFGTKWVRESVLEIFREDIARFRVVLAGQLDEDPAAVMERGGIPALSSLRLHNGTVYRWNRPCYGPGETSAHLRIENRVIPAGPTVVDAIANAAFYFGLMSADSDHYGNFSEVLPFDEAKKNFFDAARHGLDAQFTWVDGRVRSASELIESVLIPLAREGLQRSKIDSQDIDRYLGVLEERVKSGRTGSRWMLDSLAAMSPEAPRDGKARALVASTLEQQWSGRPVHDWEHAPLQGVSDVRESYLQVGQFMSTDIFTVHPEDLVDLAASLMDWERIRHIPVEDAHGSLVGLITHRALLRLVARGSTEAQTKVSVRELMRQDPVTVTPETPTLEALRKMRTFKVGCLPVLDEGKLVGMVTEQDLIEVSGRLLEAYLRGE